MRIGLFGGTFDPIHVGHLILAERCREEAELDEVWFLLSYQPPHKLENSITRFEQRCEMVSLATTGQPLFRVETIEKELPQPSYTAETLTVLHRQRPGTEFALIIGADSLVDLPQWYQPQRVLEQAELVVAPRPGVEVISQQQLADLIGLPHEEVRVRTIQCPLVDIASREIRKRVSEGKTIRFLVPRAVEEYIRERKLYQSGRKLPSLPV